MKPAAQTPAPAGKEEKVGAADSEAAASCDEAAASAAAAGCDEADDMVTGSRALSR